MRTTIDIDDEVLEAVREISRAQHISLGRALSEVTKRGLQRAGEVRLGEEEGVPVILRDPLFAQVTSEHVYRLQAQE